MDDYALPDLRPLVKLLLGIDRFGTAYLVCNLIEKDGFISCFEFFNCIIIFEDPSDRYRQGVTTVSDVEHY